MPSHLQIYCIPSEFTGAWGKNPLVDLFFIYSIHVDNLIMGDIVGDCIKTFHLESGTHQICIKGGIRQSSGSIILETLEGMTYNLVCGMNNKGQLFIEHDVPSSAVNHSKEENSKSNYSLWASVRILLIILGAIFGLFIFMALASLLNIAGLLWIPFLILCGLGFFIMMSGFSWLSGKTARKPRK